MKRYRVWEANRKVFLWPENWLEPELRDDKSPFFKEIDERAAAERHHRRPGGDGALNYLSKLEEVAKLEPCGIHYVEDDPRHGRRRRPRGGAHRRREPQVLLPAPRVRLLDAVGADQARHRGQPGIPVVWKDRLFLFWLQILKQAPARAAEKRQLGEQELGSDQHRRARRPTSNREADRAGDALLERVLQRQVAADQDVRRQPADCSRNVPVTGPGFLTAQSCGLGTIEGSIGELAHRDQSAASFMISSTVKDTHSLHIRRSRVRQLTPMRFRIGSSLTWVTDLTASCDSYAYLMLTSLHPAISWNLLREGPLSRQRHVLGTR